LSSSQPEVEKVVEAFDGNGKKVIITLWKDKHVSVCANSEPKTFECYVSSKPEGERLFYLAQAWYSSLGFKIRKLEGES